jgi:phosphate transport system protein
VWSAGRGGLTLRDVIMREEFRIDLNIVSQLLVDMAEAVREAMRQATTALLTADRRAAEGVILRDAEIDSIFRQVEERVCDLLARQAPVATDLRTLITALHVAADLERMGDLADHVARTALRRHPSPAVPAELRGVFREMAGAADRMAGKIAGVLSKPDATLAAELEQDDDTMDDLHRRLFAILLDDAWPYGVETAIDATLLGRFYERYADHAVNAGRRVVYLVTGEPA